MSRLATAAGTAASGAALYGRIRGVTMSHRPPGATGEADARLAAPSLVPAREAPTGVGAPVGAGDPTGLRYDRGDTELDSPPVPAGVELWHLGDRDLPEVTPETLGCADDPIAQALHLLSQLTDGQRAEVLGYYRTDGAS